MAYRDPRLSCPRCSIELTTGTARWQCAQGRGVLLARDKLASVALTASAVDAPVGCPACGERMAQFRVVGVALECCKRDGLVWFDGGELGFLRDYAASTSGELPMPFALAEALHAILDD